MENFVLDLCHENSHFCHYKEKHDKAYHFNMEFNGRRAMILIKNKIIA